MWHDFGQLVLSFLVYRTEKDETCLSGLGEGGESPLELCNVEPSILTGAILYQSHLLPEAHLDHPSSQRPLRTMEVPSSSCLAHFRSTSGCWHEARTVLVLSAALKALSGEEGTD